MHVKTTREAIWSLTRQPFYFNLSFARLWGIQAAVFLSYILNWSGPQADGWVFRTQDEIEADTTLSPYHQRVAREKLVAAGVLEEALRGVPARLYYRINVQALLDALAAEASGDDGGEAVAEPPAASSESRSEPDVKNFDNLQSKPCRTTKEKIKERKKKTDHREARSAFRAVAQGGAVGGSSSDSMEGNEVGPGLAQVDAGSAQAQGQGLDAAFAMAVQAFEAAPLGVVFTPAAADELRDMLSTFSVQEILDGVAVAREAVRQGRHIGRPVAYVRGIVRRERARAAERQRDAAAASTGSQGDKAPPRPGRVSSSWMTESATGGMYGILAAVRPHNSHVRR